MGSTNRAAWEAKRTSFQELILHWQGASSLEIEWQRECVGSDASSGEIVRILLDDRASRGDSIPGCGREDRPGPWAVFPINIDDYDRCAWNMVLPFELNESRTVLHVAGHALGFSHEHLRKTSPAPDCPDDVKVGPTSPYLAYYDGHSAMHYGHSTETAFDGMPWAACSDVNSTGLTTGDLLAMEMLYPTSGERSLGGTGSLPFAGTRIFRSDAPVRLVNSWVQRGASPGWFQSHFWTLSTPLDPVPRILHELHIELLSQAGAIWYVGHMFTDPFGEYHSLSETVEVSDQKHAAVLMSLL